MNKKCEKFNKCSHDRNCCEQNICGDIIQCQSGYCATINNLDFCEIVKNAFYPNGKKDPHQYRIKKDSYQQYQHKISQRSK